jgi:uncharacterized protein
MAAQYQHHLKFIVEPGSFAIARFVPGTPITFDYSAGFYSLTQTRDELSLVCLQNVLPANAKAERNRALLRVAGPLDFSLTGIIASLASPLAEAGISIFSVSTFDTDYILLRNEDLARAITVLERAGHTVLRSATA